MMAPGGKFLAGLGGFQDLARHKEYKKKEYHRERLIDYESISPFDDRYHTGCRGHGPSRPTRRGSYGDIVDNRPLRPLDWFDRLPPREVTCCDHERPTVCSTGGIWNDRHLRMRRPRSRDQTPRHPLPYPFSDPLGARLRNRAGRQYGNGSSDSITHVLSDIYLDKSERDSPVSLDDADDDEDENDTVIGARSYERRRPSYVGGPHHWPYGPGLERELGRRPGRNEDSMFEGRGGINRVHGTYPRDAHRTRMPDVFDISGDTGSSY